MIVQYEFYFLQFDQLSHTTVADRQLVQQTQSLFYDFLRMSPKFQICYSANEHRKKSRNFFFEIFTRKKQTKKKQKILHFPIDYAQQHRFIVDAHHLRQTFVDFHFLHLLNYVNSSHLIQETNYGEL